MTKIAIKTIVEKINPDDGTNYQKYCRLINLRKTDEKTDIYRLFYEFCGTAVCFILLANTEENKFIVHPIRGGGWTNGKLVLRNKSIDLWVRFKNSFSRYKTGSKKLDQILLGHVKANDWMSYISSIALKDLQK